jgi:penicillin-binding protein 1A
MRACRSTRRASASAQYCVHNFRGEAARIIPLYRALADSLNTAAIRLSIKIGEAYWPPSQTYHIANITALGRAKIIATARAMGVTTRLVDVTSLPLGADEVRMIDMVGANATLASGGARATAYAAIEARSSSGELVYSHDKDSGPPARVLAADKVAEMNNILTHVVTEGTGRAAQIPGLAIAGKTGTTNNSTNAWFNAFTGNLVGSVWFGNEVNSSCGKMTGGPLPAQTWRDIMAFAQKSLEAKPPFGVAAPEPGRGKPAPVASRKAAPGSIDARRPAYALLPSLQKAVLGIGSLARQAQTNARMSAGLSRSPAREGP